ncbi:LOW QUALITY PROTEIN: hypothetical protein HID58_060177 [Brassica napus]|uniref:Uncharacterized protein n=1 Tax=Brassica napus TaxID=3708 RepID=A0ABQ7ZV03_BRANA|nr:LOW QUALITY PROTEIN: hypothetical protein HID58_060177 [Brassica napus]
MSKRSASSVPTAADRARMDSPVSRSDSSSEPGEGSDCDLMAPLPLFCAYAAPPLVGLASSDSEDELAEWRNRYSFPSSVILRVPTAEERASSYIPGEIAVYEAFFDSGLRGTIPTLIVGLCNLFEISPSQLNPPAWRILIAIQNLGDLEYLSLGINEVLFAYHLAPLNGGESGFPIVEELPKSDRRESCSPGTTASCRSSPGYISGGVTNDPCTAYQEAAKVMSAKKGSSSRNASGDEVMITGSRRLTVVTLEPSPSLLGKRPKSGGVTTRSAHQSANMARSAGSFAVALSNLNLNVFPQDGIVLPIGDPSEGVQVLQGGLLRVSSTTCPPVSPGGGREPEVPGERDQRVGRELEVRDQKEKVKVLEKVAETSSADAFTTSQKNQEMGEEVDALKAATKTFKFEMVMGVNGARVVARWEKQTAQWDLVTTLEQYKVLVEEEARNKGVLPPTFEDEPAIPLVSEMDVDSSVKPRGSPS